MGLLDDLKKQAELAKIFNGLMGKLRGDLHEGTIHSGTLRSAKPSGKKSIRPSRMRG